MLNEDIHSILGRAHTIQYGTALRNNISDCASSLNAHVCGMRQTVTRRKRAQRLHSRDCRRSHTPLRRATWISTSTTTTSGRRCCLR
jgi:hypothetical protein